MNQRLLLLLFFSFWVSSNACRVPPEDELEVAQKQVEAARRGQANLFAPELLREAEDLLSEASLKISERSYAEARNLANEALAKAAEAEKVSLESRASQRQRNNDVLLEAGGKLSGLKTRIEAVSAEHPAAGTKLMQELAEVEGLLQLFKDKVETERFNEAQNLETTLQQRLQQLSADVDSTLSPDKAEEEGGKKR